MKILCYSYCDSNSHEGCSFKELAALTQPSIKEYCALHDYDYSFQYDGFNSNKIIGWERYDITLRELDRNIYDWIFYIDADATIMNHTIRLENIIDDNYDIMIAKNSLSKDWT